MALLNLVYSDQLFPRDAYRLTFDRMLEQLPEKSACRLMVDLLALAHVRCRPPMNEVALKRVCAPSKLKPATKWFSKANSSLVFVTCADTP